MKKLHLQILIWTSLFILLTSQLHGQGWRQEYGGPPVFNDDYAVTLLRTPDNGFLLDGGRPIKTDANGDMQWISAQTPSGRYGNRRAVMLPDGSYATIRWSTIDNQPILAKYNETGDLLWAQMYPGVVQQSNSYASSLDVTSDGEFVFVVNEPSGNTSCNCDQYHVLKTDDQGNLLWQVTNNTSLDYVANSIVALSDGGIAIAGRHGNFGTSLDLYIEKRDANGAQVWEQEWLLPDIQEFVSLIETSDGDIAATGYAITLGDEPAYIVKVDQDGNELWFQEYEIESSLFPIDLKESEYGDLAVVGYYSDSGTNHGFLMRVDADGVEKWRRYFDEDNKSEVFFSLQPLPDGGFALAGSTQLIGQGKAVLMKVDSLGNLYTHSLLGTVFMDEALDCTLDGDELGLQNWIVTATGAETFYGSTDANGQYSMLVDTGEYEVTISLPSNAWELCQPNYSIQASTIYGETVLDWALQPEFLCPVMEVSLSTAFIRPCFLGYYVVHYCNKGTEEALGATVELQLAPELSFESTTGNLLSQTGQLLSFDLGDVGINECGSFTVTFDTECDLGLIGQTLCSEAHIFPDTLCGVLSLGPIIELTGQCENDTVKFEIRNIGEDMPDMHEYIIIEDNIILMEGDFQLDEDQEMEVLASAANGATYHLVAAQSPGYLPELGNHVASFSIEGCVGDPNPEAFNQILLDDGQPWLDIECREVTAAYDPNDKTPSPTGWTAENLIDNLTDLEYRIRFQNTGNDTAFTVVLIDTLSSLLNPASVRPGASSHPYQFELSGQGVLRFTFNNILLPDSTTNEAGSQGFVQFRIEQQPNNPIGAVIENTADIYFDFNAPITTNTTWHTIGEPWVGIVSGSLETFRPSLEVQVFPNPFHQSATFRLLGAHQSAHLELYDLSGQLLRSQALEAGEAQIERRNLSAGMYLFRIVGEQGLLASGKVMVR